MDKSQLFQRWKKTEKKPSLLGKNWLAHFLIGERACLNFIVTPILLKIPLTILLVQRTPIRQNPLLLNHLFSHLSGSKEKQLDIDIIPPWQTQPMNQLDNCLILLYAFSPPPLIWIIIQIAFKPPFPKFFNFYLKEREKVTTNRSKQTIPTQPLSFYLANPKYTV